MKNDKTEDCGTNTENSNPFRFEYMLLSRLQSDNEYFLNHGGAAVKHLHQLGVDEQIVKMKELWNKFPEHMKPEWLSMQGICSYEARMKEALRKKIEEEKELCEGCDMRVPLEDMSSVMEMCVCNKCKNDEH